MSRRESIVLFSWRVLWRALNGHSKVAQNQVYVHDLHATVLHRPGRDHEKLTYRYAGRDFRLTDVEGRVIEDII